MFVLTLRQCGGLSHMILCLPDFLLFVLVFVVLGINVILPWKPLFLSAFEYIRIDSLKATSLDEVLEINLAIVLGIPSIIVGLWFDFLHDLICMI